MTSFTVSSGTSTTARTLKSGESGSVASGATLNAAITWDTSGSAGTATLTNSGTISNSGRAIDTPSNDAGSVQNLSITNNAGASITGSSDFARIQKSIGGGAISVDNSGTITGTSGRGINMQEYTGIGGFTYTGRAGSTFQASDDVIRMTSQASPGAAFNGTATIDNSGAIKATGNGQALDLNDLIATSANHIHMTNRAAGLMQAANADAVRTGNYALVDNYGKIEAKFTSGTGNASGNDAIDTQTNANVTVNNYQGGQILGARHGITGANAMTVSNDGTITGNQGSGINLDSTSGTTTITNDVHGVITGTATSSTDGDAVDVDYLVNLTNHGTIQALGTFTGSGLNEALAIGGGTVVNDGTISSAQRAITVDDSDLGAAFGTFTLTNSGTITGGNGSAIAITGTRNDSITNSGTITGSVSMDAGNDTLTNSGSISGAIDLGLGNDIANWNGLVTGTVGGGGGTDAVAFGGTFNGSSGSASFTGFESISGTLTGSTGNDVLNFGSQSWSGSLTVNGGNGADTITGGAETDTIDGGTGTDTLKGGAGNDIINGGADSDTAIFGGTLAAATVTRSGSAYTVVSADGTDTVSGVENFQFSDGTYASAGLGNAGPALTGAHATLAHGTEDQSYTVSAAQLLTGYTDANGDTLSIGVVATSNGAIVNNGNGTYTITPDADFNGAVTLNYTVADGYGGIANGQISYIIDNVNDAPVQTDYQAVLPHAVEDVAYTVTRAQLLQGFSDADGDTLSISALVAGNGTVTDNLDGTYTINNNPNYHGQSALSYTISDGHGGTVNALLALVVDPANDTPTLTGAQAVLAHGTEDAAYTVSAAQLLEGFADVDGDALSVSGLTAANGTVTDNLDGTYTVSPTTDFNGATTLNYAVVDGQGGSVAANLGYVVDAVNDGPALTGAHAVLAHGTEDQSYTVSATDLLTGFSDIDGDTLSVSNVAASSGTVTDNGDGTYTIAPTADFNGPAVLNYTVSDGQDGTANALLGYIVDPANDAPALIGTQATLAAGTEDVAYTVSAADLLTGFSDIDGDTLTVSDISASNGLIADNGDGTYTVTPVANFNGAVTLSYTVQDAQGGSVAASLGYVVNAVNDVPTLTGAQAVLAHGTEDVAYTVSAAALLTGFSDIDGDVLNLSGLSANHGTVTDNLDGTYTIMPAVDYFGGVTLNYSVFDGHGGSVSASIDYVVDAVADTITGTAGNDILIGTSGNETIIGLAGNDQLFGNGGDDVLRGGAKDDLLDGGAGTDTASYADIAAAVTVDLSTTGQQNTKGGGFDYLIRIENLVGTNMADKLYGDGGANRIDGSGGADEIFGRNGHDLLIGGDGADTLDGGAGADLMDGGLGNDKYYVDDTGDQVVESSADGGTADNVFAGISFTLGDNVEKLNLTGLAAINGTGNALDNILVGNDSANILSGGGGKDTLTGGLGADTFLFDLFEPAVDKDTIKDFVSGTDHVALSVSAFTGLAGYGLGALDANELVIGTKAVTANQHLIYNATTGGLFYDADGAGGAAQIQIAVLTGHPALAASDIMLIA